jgi:hypothetical protein
LTQLKPGKIHGNKNRAKERLSAFKSIIDDFESKNNRIDLLVPKLVDAMLKDKDCLSRLNELNKADGKFSVGVESLKSLIYRNKLHVNPKP